MAATDTVPRRIKSVAERHPDLPIILSKDAQGDFQPVAFKEFFEIVKVLGTGFAELGIRRGDHIGIIADNRKEWLMTDMALLSLGAIDVPRGSDTMTEEIGYILRHADCPTVFAENATQTRKILSKKDSLPELKRIIVFDYSEELSDEKGVEIIDFQDVLEQGKKALEVKPNFFDEEMEKGNIDDLATLIYTSGTTGEPKGVMLTHRSFIFQMDRVFYYVPIDTGHVVLSVLPVWHSFERAIEYIVVGQGAALAYSKPVGQILLADMKKVRPHWVPSVPRIWESVRNAVYNNANKSGGAKKALFHFFIGVGSSHAVLNNQFRGLLPQFKKRSKVIDIGVSVIPLALLTPFALLGNLLVFGKLKNLLGGRFKAAISGGGALPSYVDKFFQAAGITLLEGYGLTETAPVLSVRKMSGPVPGTIGQMLRDIEFRILDSEGKELPPGRKGVLYVKSEQIMQGYYKRPDATEEVLKDGWLNTGDIAIATINGELKILGRAKETIVLLGGENIEPVPIEDKLKESPAIDQVMVIGQDQKFLGALIVPTFEQLEEIAKSLEVTYIQIEELLENAQMKEYYHNEIQTLISPQNGFRPFERVFRFKLLPKPFAEGKEMTQTLKLKRNVIEEVYAKEIQAIFK
jgi:long-chain acyl-CoA synthetase